MKKKKRAPGVTYCWFCKKEMVWGGDHDFSDYGLKGSGVVANLSCPGCGATAEFKSGEVENEG